MRCHWLSTESRRAPCLGQLAEKGVDHGRHKPRNNDDGRLFAHGKRGKEWMDKMLVSKEW